MNSLQDTYALRKAGDYSRPRRASQAIPLVYGDMRAEQGGGVWPAVCVDSANHVYAYCGGPALSAQEGNQVRVFTREGQELTGFTFNHHHDLEGRGAIATLTFGEDVSAGEPLSLSGFGRASGRGLLQNPLDVLRDFLGEYCGLEEERIDNASWARARGQCEVLGQRAAGAVTKDQAVSQTLSELLSCFLGSWWLDARGRLRVSLTQGPGMLAEAETAACFRGAETADAVLEASLDNLCNRLTCSYAYNWVSGEYEGYDDGRAEAEPRSRSLYGDQARSLELPWLRDKASARAVQRSLVGAFAFPVRLLSLTQESFASLHAERGDYVWLSCPWLRGSQRQPLVNQLMRVLSVEPDLDKRTIGFTLMDTGFWKTLAYPADGSLPADGAQQAGSRRDTREAVL